MVERDRLGALVWRARATLVCNNLKKQKHITCFCVIFNILKIKLKLITS